jgi:hypothetical protein
LQGGEAMYNAVCSLVELITVLEHHHMDIFMFSNGTIVRGVY